ncbi:TPA: hypothetical protein N0F65_010971, partial [Lagenidium giganteum]
PPSEQSPLCASANIEPIVIEIEGSPELRVAVGPSVCAMEISLDQVRVQGEGLLFVTATVQGKDLRMLVDSGATHCIVRSGLLSHPDGVELKELRARDFEGKVKSTQSCVFDVPLRVAGRECTVGVVECPARF